MSLLSRTKKLFAKQETDAAKPAHTKPVPATGGEVELQALLSEKAFAVQTNANTAVFRVRRDATKREIAEAIKQKYGADVLDVRTIVMRGKQRRRGATRGATAGWKKAYVKVKDIQALNTAP